ncbi:transketolase, putative, partial [Ichthyophthirius multifiliis]
SFIENQYFICFIFKQIRYDYKYINIQNIKSFTVDRFILSKCHVAPILYAIWSLVGLIPQSEFLKIRKFGSRLESNPTPRLPFLDVAAESFGQGLGAASEMAYSSKYLDKITNRFYVLLGDGECAEGSVWEQTQTGSVNLRKLSLRTMSNLIKKGSRLSTGMHQ